MTKTGPKPKHSIFP